MLPYLFYDLKDMIKTLLGHVGKPKVLEKAKTMKGFMAIDLNDDAFLSSKEIHVGFAADDTL